MGYDEVMSDPFCYRITTLGCRVNHAEARDIKDILHTRGLIPATGSHPADLEVIHTCSVTHTAAAKSRQAIRRAIRRQREASPSPSSRSCLSSQDTGKLPEIIITGCYGGTNAREAAALVNSPHQVIPHQGEDDSTMIERFARQIDEWLHRRLDDSADLDSLPIESAEPDNSRKNGILPLPFVGNPVHMGNSGVGSASGRYSGGHVRAELKIQEGCDAHCTFCIIPKIRRTLRSKTISDAVREAAMLVDRGHIEIVLTGIFIGAYGHETALRRKQKHRDAHPLADLLDAVAQIPGVERLRISSMEPGDVTEPLLDAMIANRPVVVPHLHLPLQSGSDAILKMMNRQYRVGDYLDMINRVNEALTEDGLPPAVTTDIICGFPGETNADFEQTVSVAERVGFLHMHVFPYSPRAGTAAARWSDRHLAPPLIKSRVRQLIELEENPQNGLSTRYRQRLLGRTVRVILEQPDGDNQGGELPLMTGRCDHYALIHVPSNRPRGEMVHVHITNVTSDFIRGEVASSPVTLPVLSQG